MPVLPIVRLGHPALRTPAEPVVPARVVERAFQRLIDDMIETMRAAEGVGLAAPQVGFGLQLFVYEALEAEDPARAVPAIPAIPLRAVVNPMVEPLSGEQIFDWEGCLSIPDLRGLVPRHPSVRLRGVDRHGHLEERVVEGFEARIVQHEYDHLNCVLFLDRMSDLKSLAFVDEWQEFLHDAADDGPRSKAE